MPKLKAKKKDITIDMAPLVDLTFLLITFFMLTIQFKPPEVVTVNMPQSVASDNVPTDNIIIISADAEGNVFFGVRSKNTRQGVIDRIMQNDGIKLTEEQVEQFALMEDVGVAFKDLPAFLSLEPRQRKEYYESDDFTGIPVDTTGLKPDERTDFYKYVRYARESYQMETGEPIRIMVKADQKTPIKTVKMIFHNLKLQRANKFNLITSQESMPRAWANYQAPKQQ